MNVCFIYNPESGSGKIVSYLEWIEEEFKKNNHQITLLRTNRQNDAYLYALNSVEYDMLLVAGGDGTLNEVVNGVMQLSKKPLIGYLPTGTANDFGHLIGMPKNIKKAVRTILEKKYIKEVDISKINNKYFVYVAAAGKFTKASYDIERKHKKKYGPLAYFIGGSKELFKSYNIPIEAEFAEGTFNEPCTLILILNGARVGGFRLPRVKTKLDDGKVSIRFFKNESWSFFRIAAFLLTGGLYDTNKNRTFKSNYIKVKTDDDVDWNIDGEFMGQGSIEVKVIPKAIKFFINPKKEKKAFIKVNKRII